MKHLHRYQDMLTEFLAATTHSPWSTETPRKHVGYSWYVHVYVRVY